MKILGTQLGQAMKAQTQMSEVSHPLPLGRFVETIRKATARAIAEQRAMGLSIAVWRNGKIEHIPADQPFPPT